MPLFREVELVDEMENLKVSDEKPSKDNEKYENKEINNDLIKLIEDIVDKVVNKNNEFTPKKPIKQLNAPPLVRKRKAKLIERPKKIRKLDWIKNV